jgi:dipeptidyl aminopeptidase/acylaminoacyl peptidase
MKLRTFVLVVIAASTAFAVAQNGGNRANWKLMERYSNATLGRFVYSSTVNPNFINETDEFWYVWNDSKGERFMHVDPKARRKERAFDHDKLAAALTELSKKPVVGNQLPFNSISYNKDATAITFVVERQNYEWNLKDETLKKTEPPSGQSSPGPGPGPGGGGGGGFQGGGQGQGNRPTFSTAPDELAFVYTQGYNLYYGEKAKKEDEPDKVTGTEKLTTDGEQFYEFRSVNYSTYTLGDKQEVKRSVGASWSKDSKAFAVSRSDARKVSDLFVINSLSNPRPTVETYKYQMPGEENVQQTEIYLFTRDDKKVRRVPVEKWKDQTVSNVHWIGKDSSKLRFSRRDRLQRNQELCEYDTATNEVKVILEESTENAFIESQPTRYVDEDNMGDIVWWSERSGWGHYYLYTHEGKLKNAITSGAWRAESVVELDREGKKLYFSAVGKEDEDLYNSHHYVVGLDGKGMRLLDEGDADHTLTPTKSKDFFVDRYSRVDLPPKSVVRDRDGDIVMELEDMDLSRLSETGWRAPERFTVKAADGVTDIYGNMWKPFDFDPYKKYPIILSIYPGPQTEQVTQTFSATGANQELAQLGFIVIQIGNRGGTPQRSNAYHSYGYYNLRDYGLADKKAGVEQLALKYPWIDIDRVGIYGHSGGGFMTAAAMLLPPFNDFFKVGVSSAGNHDNNIYNANWSEQHHGLRIAQQQQQQQQGGGGRGGRGGSGGGGGGEPDQSDWDGLIELVDQQQTGTQTQEKFEIKVPTNVEIAANLKGKLLLVHGDIDNNVHPGNTIRLVDALIRANKRFDFMIMPGQRHGFGQLSGYFNQMLKEYFATHLLGDDYSRSADINDKGK